MSVRTLLSRLSRRAWIVTGCIVLVAAGATVFTLATRSGDAGSAEPITQTATASRRTLQKTVSTTGSVTPKVQEDISFSVSGTVTAVNVKAGQTVAVGDVLATVDTLQVNADLLDARATLAEATATLASAQDADDGGDATQARVDAAQAAVEVATAAVADAEEAMDDTTLVAPAAGLITAVNVEVSDRVSGGSSGGSPSGGGASTMGGGSTTSSAAFTLVSTDAWVVDVTVGETDIANVAVGQSVELTTDDRATFTGTVTEVGLLPSATSGSARYPVSVDIEGTGEGLLDGISVDVSIIYESREDVLTVPSAAVTTANGTSTVTLVQTDGGQQTVQVTVGETSGNYTEILSGLDEGDEVLVSTFAPGEGNGGQVPGGQFPGGGQGGFPGGGQGGFPGGGQGGFPGGGQGGFPGGGQGGFGGGQ